MRLFNHIVQAFKGSRATDDTTEYVPHASYDWRGPLLLEAARKHGKPFKCAGDDLPREIILGGKELVVVGADMYAMQGSAQPNCGPSKRVQSVLARLSGSEIIGSRSTAALQE